VTWIRFLLALFGLLAAIPALLTFHSLPFWKATLAVGEYGHRFALLPALLLLWGPFDRGPAARLSGLLAVAALVLFLIPTVLMFHQGRSLHTRLKGAFGLSMPAWTPDLPAYLLGTAPSPSPKSPPVQPLQIPLPDGSPLSILFHPAHANSAAPCLVVLHSGGWERGSADEFPAWTRHWTSRGIAVASIAYRLAPAHPWPAQHQDVTTTLQHLKQYATALGLSGSHFVLLGRSAGGQIATACAHSLNDPAIRGCVALYAPADMTFAWKYADPTDVLDSPRLLRQYLSGSPEESPENYRSASAIELARPNGPSTLLVHGRRDVLVWELQSRRFTAHLARQNIPHHFLDLPWATHALDYPWHGPSSHLLRPALDAFLDHVFATD
jgi:acetyl esterase/lipase